MGGATVAQQLLKTNNDSFLTAFNANSSQLDDNNSSASMDNLIPSTNGWPIEDLTGEVHDLMLRESMTWLPWMDENDTNSSIKDVFPMENFDSQLLAQTLQLDGLFGQELNLDHLDESASSLFYDELTFDPSPIATPLSSPTEQQPMTQVLNGDDPSPVDSETTESINSAVSPTCQGYDIQHCHESFEEVGEDEPNAPLPVIADIKEDDSSTDEDDDDDDDGDSEDEDGPVSVMTTTYMYLPKRQVEEALLSKITGHLQPDKLPGILSIVSSTTDDQKEGEVEIDLSCLAREQLVRVMLYVDACITEQQGGPKVKLSDYMVKQDSNKTATTTATATAATMAAESDDEVEEKVDSAAGQKRKRRRKQRVSTNSEDGPMSMAALTKKSKSRKPTPNTNGTMVPSLSTISGPKRRRTRKKQQDASVSIPVSAKYQDPNCLASTRPKRRSAALHKRRMLEEMLLLPSDDDDNAGAAAEEDNLDHQVMVTYGEEQMDFRVVDNQTIVHQPHVSALSVASESMAQAASPGIGVSIAINDEDEDEEIDIM